MCRRPTQLPKDCHAATPLSCSLLRLCCSPPCAALLPAALTLRAACMLACTCSWCSAEINWRTRGICEGDDAPGWTIVIILCCFSVVYFGGGIGFGRHKNPPREGASLLTHPQGEDTLAWHPHADGLRQLPGLVSDGYRFALWHYQKWRGGSGGHWEPVGGGGGGDPMYQRLDDLDSQLDAPQEQKGLISAAQVKPPRRKSESAVSPTKKKHSPKKKKKPRPSLTTLVGEGEGEGGPGGRE